MRNTQNPKNRTVRQILPHVVISGGASCHNLTRKDFLVLHFGGIIILPFHWDGRKEESFFALSQRGEGSFTTTLHRRELMGQCIATD